MSSDLSVDLRESVVAAIQKGALRREVAWRFEVSPASAVRWHETSEPIDRVSDLNPIEQPFAKLRASCAPRHRGRSPISGTSASGPLRRFTLDKGCNYLTAAGYDAYNST